MTVLKTHISWTHSTWNPSTGCTKISQGCKFCYAEAIVERWGGHDFREIVLHPERLSQVGKFRTPVTGDDGAPAPRMVFVNSMSDLMHEKIPDAFRDRVFDAIETTPLTVYQVLTKRDDVLARYIAARYPRGVPAHIWLGVSVEDNRVKARIDTLRGLMDKVGPFTAFLSVEPLIGPCDEHDYAGIAWVLVGGESGNNARPMDPDWARHSIAAAGKAGAQVWFKQWGAWPNNPLYPNKVERVPLNPQRPSTHIDRVREAIRRGEKLAQIVITKGRPIVTGEKGGATIDGRTWRQLPPAYAALKQRLRAGKRALV